MTNEELIEKYPIYMEDWYGLKEFYNAFLKPFPKKDRGDYNFLCEMGITFSKGGMPFRATFKHDYEADVDYFDIVPYGKNKPHLMIRSDTIEYPVTLESIQNTIEEVVDKAFRKRNDGLDAQEIEPYPYLDKSDDIDNLFTEAIETAIYHNEYMSLDEISCTQRDIGDVRLTITPGDYKYFGPNDRRMSSLQMNLAIMREPQTPYCKDPTREHSNIELLEWDFTQDIQNATEADMRNMINAQLTSLVRQEGRYSSLRDLKEALASTEYRWMQHTLHNATISPNLDGYTLHGVSIKIADMPEREREQFNKVITDALLKEQPSKTLWLSKDQEFLDGLPKGTPLTDYKILGVSSATIEPAFDVQLSNGQKIVVFPDECLPSQMKATGCPYIEKEYGIPENQIPKPLSERGIFGKRKDQIRELVDKDIQNLFQKLHDDFGITPDEATKLVRKAVTNAQTQAKEPNAR